MKKFLSFFAAATVLVSLAACGGSDSSDEPDAPDDPSENNKPSEMTVGESKTFLENSALEALSLFNANDHKEVIGFCLNVADTYGDLEAPESWEEDEYDRVSPAHICRRLANALRTADASGARGAATAYIYEFGKYTGIYEPGKWAWERTGDSKDIIFRFTLDGQNCEVKVAASGTNEDVTFTEEEWDYWDGYTEQEYVIRAPKSVELSIKKGNTTMASGKVNVEFSMSAHTVSTYTKVSVANIAIEAKVDANDSNLTENQTMTVGGKQFVTTSTVVNGNNLCNQKSWKSLCEDPTKRKVDNMLKDATTSIDILGKVQFKGKVSNFGEIVEACADGNYFDDYDYSSKTEAEAACKALCKVLNNSVVVKMFYNGGSNVEASLLFEPDFEDYYYGWEYYVNGILQFADGSKYSVDEYFDSFSFSNVEKQLYRLYEDYESLWY